MQNEPEETKRGFGFDSSPEQKYEGEEGVVSPEQGEAGMEELDAKKIAEVREGRVRQARETREIADIEGDIEEHTESLIEKSGDIEAVKQGFREVIKTRGRKKALAIVIEVAREMDKRAGGNGFYLDIAHDVLAEFFDKTPQ